MITIDKRFFAVVTGIAAGSFFVTVLVISAASNRLTVHDVTVLVISGAVAVVAALWLYRDRRQHGRQP